MAKSSNKTAETTKEPQALPGHSTQYDYVLAWIKEAVEARRAQNAYVERAFMAYETKPSVNRYKGTINQYVDGIKKYDMDKARLIEAACSDVPEKGSLVVQNAVETVVSMAMGGVGQYQFGPYDPDMKVDHKVADRLAAQAKFFYNNNKVDAIVPQYIREAVLAGVSYMHVKKKNGKTCITLLETSQMITDPKRFKTNFQRFIGFSQRESFQAIKARTKKIKGGGYVLKTLNEAEIYVSQIKQEMNSVLQADSTNEFLHDEIRRDVDIFYKPIITRIKEDREQDDPNKMYDGDEVEISYLYDEMNDMYFEVINRRYITVAKSNPLKRDIKCKFYDQEGKEKEKTKTVKLDNPFVELPFVKLPRVTYPVSPLFYLLDDFDDLCAMESVLFHNASIQGPLTFVGQSSDAEKVSRVASVSGEVVEGLPQTFGVLNKAHDNGPLIMQIQRFEERIKRTMKAVDPFELQAMIGDRATAKEVVSASGQVAQGINPFLANIESAMATLGDKFIKLELIMNDKEYYSFEHNGRYYEVARDEMALDYEIGAKLVSSIKLEQEANSRKALETVQYLNGNEAVDMKAFLGTMVPIILTGLVTREQAQNMVLPTYRPMPDEIIAAIKRRAEEDAKKDEVDRLDFDGYTSEQIDQMTAGFSAANAAAGGIDYSQALGMPVDNSLQQPASVDPNTGAPVDMYAGPPVAPTDPSVLAATGVAPTAVGSPEMAGVVANDQAGQGYV